jgi:hypothetical protein
MKFRFSNRLIAIIGHPSVSVSPTGKKMLKTKILKTVTVK